MGANPKNDSVGGRAGGVFWWSGEQARRNGGTSGPDELTSGRSGRQLGQGDRREGRRLEGEWPDEPGRRIVLDHWLASDRF